MKKIIIIALVLFIAVANTNAQNNADSNLSSPVLQSYFNIKNALIAGNSSTASESATSLVEMLGKFSNTAVSGASLKALMKDAGTIAGSKNLDKQRSSFANLSINMAVVVKAAKLAARPVYYAYCPMKKAYWLSSEVEIKNPYYGNAMLTCGEVVETIRSNSKP